MILECKLDLVLARGPLGQHTTCKQQGGVVKDQAMSALHSATQTKATTT